MDQSTHNVRQVNWFNIITECQQRPADISVKQGRHPNAYHDFVLDEMRNIDNIANGNKDIFLDLYESEIISIIRDNPDMLYSNYWKGIKE